MYKYQDRLALNALRRLAAGKKSTPTGRRAMIEKGYIDDNHKITKLGEQVLRVRG